MFDWTMSVEVPEFDLFPVPADSDRMEPEVVNHCCCGFLGMSEMSALLYAGEPSVLFGGKFEGLDLAGPAPDHDQWSSEVDLVVLDLVGADVGETLTVH